MRGFNYKCIRREHIADAYPEKFTNQSEKYNNPTDKWARDPNTEFTEKEMQTAISIAKAAYLHS